MNASAKPKTNIRTEALAGVTTFFTMVYIVVVNPQILSTEGTGMAFSGVLTATVLVCFTMTLLMGALREAAFCGGPGDGGGGATFVSDVDAGAGFNWLVAAHSR